MRPGIPVGAASLAFEAPVYIQSAASVAGKKESEGPLGSAFDKIILDPMYGTGTWENAESALQMEAASLALEKAGLRAGDIRLAFAGDLLAQTIATSFGVGEMEIPFYGLYGACSAMGEALSLASMACAAGYGEHFLCAASSHFATAEKEFRFPLGYGNQRPLSATWTVTGSGACILGSQPPQGAGCARITGITPGKVVDFGLKDSLNMGGCMAPAACDTIRQNLKDFGRSPSDYDAIVTGDLGMVGQKILLDLLSEDHIDLSGVHQDCGLLVYDNEAQDTHSGGSGCGCSAVVLAASLLPKLVSGEWQRILFVPTGALLSKVSYNEGESVPGIAHGVVIEHAGEPKEGSHGIL